MRSSNFAPLLTTLFLAISVASSVQQTATGNTNFNISDGFSKVSEPDFTWTISDLKTQMKESDNNFTLLSEVFPLKGYSFGAQARLTLDEDNYLWISLSYKDLNNTGRALNMNLIPSVIYTYKQQEPSPNIIRNYNYLFATTMQYDEFHYYALILPFDNIANDNISIDIRVEAPEVTLQSYFYDGTVTGTIDNFRLKKGMEAKGLIGFQLSPYFYTSPEGYRMRALMYLNGFNDYEGKGLTVFIAFLTGPNDADLSTSFKREATIVLWKPTDSNNRVVKSVTHDSVSKYDDVNDYKMIDVGSNAEIENLLVNDTLNYRIKIVPV